MWQACYKLIQSFRSIVASYITLKKAKIGYQCSASDLEKKYWAAKA